MWVNKVMHIPLAKKNILYMLDMQYFVNYYTLFFCKKMLKIYVFRGSMST